MTGEAAFGLACELILAGEARAMLAGAVEERSSITERVLGPVCAGSGAWVGVRTEGASVLLLEDEAQARARGATSLCAITHVASGRGAFSSEAAAIPAPPPGRPLVVVARRDDATLVAVAETAWAGVPIVEVASRAGNHESLGGFCIVAAAASIAAGRADGALVIGVAPDRWAAVALSAR